MFEEYMGVIKALGFNFAPENWGYCSGGLIAVSQYSALFSLLGCRFGGDCRTSFGLPDLRGRLPMGQGDGPGLTPRLMGQMVGWYEEPLAIDYMPMHTHSTHYTGDSAGTAPTVRVAASGGKKQLPDDGDYIAAPGNALGVPQGNLFLAPNDVAGKATLGGVSGNGGGFDNNNFHVIPTPQAQNRVQIMQPTQAVNYCICMEGLYPSRS